MAEGAESVRPGGTDQENGTGIKRRDRARSLSLAAAVSGVKHFFPSGFPIVARHSGVARPEREDPCLFPAENLATQFAISLAAL